MLKDYWRDFQSFAVRGNVVDLSVGVVIGAAFSKITDAIVRGLISPPLGFLTGGINVGDKVWTIVRPDVGPDGAAVQGTGLVLQYGLALEACIDFFIIALVIFSLLRLIRRTREKAEDPKDATVPTPKDIELLSEIRDGINSLAQAARGPSA